MWGREREPGIHWVGGYIKPIQLVAMQLAILRLYYFIFIHFFCEPGQVTLRKGECAKCADDHLLSSEEETIPGGGGGEKAEELVVQHSKVVQLDDAELVTPDMTRLPPNMVSGQSLKLKSQWQRESKYKPS